MTVLRNSSHRNLLKKEVWIDEVGDRDPKKVRIHWVARS